MERFGLLPGISGLVRATLTSLDGTVIVIGSGFAPCRCVDPRKGGELSGDEHAGPAHRHDINNRRRTRLRPPAGELRVDAWPQATDNRE